MNISDTPRWGRLIRQERIERNWRQRDLADLLGTTLLTVHRWEQGKQCPGAYYRVKLCALFGKSAEDLGLVPGQEEAPHEETSPAVSEEVSARSDMMLSSPLAEHQRLIGREPLISQLVQRLCSARGAFALTGLPGVGKTTIAASVARHSLIHQQFRDGIVWIGLGQNPEVLEEMNALASLLGLKLPERTLLTTIDSWARYIHEKVDNRRMLFIIDDAWKLEDAVIFQLGGTNTVYLLTTRFPAIALPFAYEKVIHLEELNEEDSRALLEHLVPQSFGGLLESQMRALARLVGGLPLALTLIGRYLYVQAHSGQPRRLQRALERLVQNVQERLQVAEPQVLWEYSLNMPIGTSLSLEKTIEMSEQALPENAQQALHALSIFAPKPRSFSEEAALAICQSDVDVLDLLVDSGLLECPQPGRYCLHQMIADYARFHCADLVLIEQRFITFFTTFVQTHQSVFERLDEDFSQILAAFDLALAHQRLADVIAGVLALVPYLEARRFYSPAEMLLTQAQQAAIALADQESVARCWLALGRMAELKSELLSAEQAYLAALVIAKDIGHVELVGQLLILASGVMVDRGDFARADLYGREALFVSEVRNDPARRCVALKQLGEIADNLGNWRQAQALYEQGLLCARQLENWEIASALLQNLGAQAVQQGNYQQADAYYQKGLIYARRIDHLQRQSALLLNQGMLAFHREQYQEAVTLSLESLRLARTLGNRLRVSSALQNLGMIESVQANYRQAESYLAESLQLARDIGHRWLICETLGEWGMHYIRQQKFILASRTFQEMLESARTMGARLLVAQALFGLSQTQAGAGNMEEALAHAQESQVIFEQLKQEQKSRHLLSWLTTLSQEQRQQKTTIPVAEDGTTW